MPHVDGRPAAKVSSDLVQLRVWEVIDRNIPVRMSCDNCHHETTWLRTDMEKRLSKWRGQSMLRLSMSLRCRKCRSNYVHVWRP